MPATDILPGQWIDIQALPTPVASLNLPGVLFVILTIILLAMLLRFIWQQPKFKALRQLRGIPRQTDNTRQQLFLLHQVLQQGLQVRQLENRVFATQRQDNWQRFCQELVHYRYRTDAPATTDVSRLTMQARDWLKQL